MIEDQNRQFLRRMISPLSKLERENLLRWKQIGCSNNVFIVRFGGLLASIGPLTTSLSQIVIHLLEGLYRGLLKILNGQIFEVLPELSGGLAKSGRSMLQVILIISTGILGLFFPTLYDQLPISPTEEQKKQAAIDEIKILELFITQLNQLQLKTIDFPPVTHVLYKAYESTVRAVATAHVAVLESVAPVVESLKIRLTEAREKAENSTRRLIFLQDQKALVEQSIAGLKKQLVEVLREARIKADSQDQTIRFFQFQKTQTDRTIAELEEQLAQQVNAQQGIQTKT